VTLISLWAAPSVIRPEEPIEEARSPLFRRLLGHRSARHAETDINFSKRSLSRWNGNRVRGDNARHRRVKGSFILEERKISSQIRLSIRSARCSTRCARLHAWSKEIESRQGRDGCIRIIKRDPLEILVGPFEMSSGRPRKSEVSRILTCSR